MNGGAACPNLEETETCNTDQCEEPGTIDKEPGPDYGTIVYYILISIPVAFTIFGLIYMCRSRRTNREIRKTCREIRETCCKCCVDLEKEDKNLDYGDYYDQDGERRQDVMEMQDNNPTYESASQAVNRNPNQIEDYDYM